MATSLSAAATPKSITSLSDIYKVNLDSAPIVLGLQIGAAGQSGISKVRLGGDLLIDSHVGNINGFQIGTGEQCNGKFLSVKTLVTDIQGVPNDTSVDFSLQGGASGNYSFLLSKTVAEDGDSVLYEIQIFFFN